MRIEFIYLSLIVIFFYNSIIIRIINIFIFLCAIVCEAALGLRILIVVRFFYGNEITKSINLIKC